MGLFSKQFANVIEWSEYRDDVIFWKWTNNEIKKDSRLIVHQGQDAIFLYNGRIEGIFTDEGSYEIESQIIPFLSTLKGFKFGFNSGLRAEVLFVNTKIFNIKWGTKNAISLPAPGLPGGMPIRAFGTFDVKVNDYLQLIDSLAGVKQIYTIDDIRDYVISILDPLLMKWISREGKDMFNLQMNSQEISQGIKTDLDMALIKIGLTVLDFKCSNFSYPQEVQEMQKKAASQSMVGDMNRYQQFAVTDAVSKSGHGGNAAVDMASMQMGMMMGQQMVNNMAAMNQNAVNQNTTYQNTSNQNTSNQGSTSGVAGNVPKFCPNCGTPTNGGKFCTECGQKLV